MPLQLRQWPVALGCGRSEKKSRRTFAIRRRFLRVLGNAAIIALSLVSVNSVHGEKKPPDGHSSGGKGRALYASDYCVEAGGPSTGGFCLSARVGFDLDQVERFEGA